MAIVNAEDYRRTLIDQANYVLNHSVRFWLTDEARRILKAQRSFWENASQAVMEEAFTRYKQTEGKEDDNVPPSSPFTV